MDPKLIEQARTFYLAEMNDHLTYQALAERVPDESLADLLRRIAAMELGHAGFWQEQLLEAGIEVPPARVKAFRLRIFGLLMGLLNPLLVISALELGETAAYDVYYRVLEEGRLSPQQAERLRRIIVDELEHESAFHEKKEPSGFSNVRDFILGMNDGLVEILGAVTGLSAAYPGNPLVVAVSGLIVGVAGALAGSILLAGLALATVGSLISVLSGISMRTKILEMVVSGFSAAGLAWLFGYLMQALFGVNL